MFIYSYIYTFVAFIANEQIIESEIDGLSDYDFERYDSSNSRNRTESKHCFPIGIVIGDNVKIGVNVVVITDILDECTAVGILAKIIGDYK